MDPLSITASCLGIISGIAQTSTAISTFVRAVRDARQDLAATSRQLAELTMVLDLLVAENENMDEDDLQGAKRQSLGMPESIKKQIIPVLSNCHDVLRSLNVLLESYQSGPLRSAKWAMKGKSDVEGYNKQLDAHLRALNIALEVSTLAAIRDVKQDTNQLTQQSSMIKGDTEMILETAGALRGDTNQILAEIYRLQSLLPAASVAVEEDPSDFGPIMQRYIDSITEYSESVLDGGHQSRSPETPCRHLAERGPSSNKANEASHSTHKILRSQDVVITPDLAQGVRAHTAIWESSSSIIFIEGDYTKQVFRIQIPFKVDGPTLVPVRGAIRCLSISPDQASLVLGLEGDTFWIHKSATQVPKEYRSPFPSRAGLVNITFSPDSRYLATRRSPFGTELLRRGQDGDYHHVQTWPYLETVEASFSPDSRQLALAHTITDTDIRITIHDTVDNISIATFRIDIRSAGATNMKNARVAFATVNSCWLATMWFVDAEILNVYHLEAKTSAGDLATNPIHSFHSFDGCHPDDIGQVRGILFPKRVFSVHSYNGRTLAAISRSDRMTTDRVIDIWELKGVDRENTVASAHTVCVIKLEGRSLYCPSISPSLRYVSAEYRSHGKGATHRDNGFMIWEIPGGEESDHGEG